MYNLSDKIRYHLQSTLELCDSSTIAYQYINRLNFEDLNMGTWRDFYKGDNSLTLPNINFSLLRGIVDEKKVPIPKNNAFAIHLRLGDKIRDPVISNFKTLLSELIKKHELNLKYKLCRVYYGNHNNTNHKESLEFIESLKNFLKEKFFIDLKFVSNEPDIDFCNLCNEPCLIPTTGGFSWLSASINPNNVIWDMLNNSSCSPTDLYQVQSAKSNQLKIKKT
jgi:hypothetical protein